MKPRRQKSLSAPIMAAGGIVMTAGRLPLVAVVQRRKDDGGVLPKGKLKPPESAVAAREKKNLPGFVQVGTIPGLPTTRATSRRNPALGRTPEGFAGEQGMGSNRSRYPGGRLFDLPSVKAGVEAIGPYLCEASGRRPQPRHELASRRSSSKGRGARRKEKLVEPARRERGTVKKGGSAAATHRRAREYLADVTSARRIASWPMKRSKAARRWRA